MLRLSSIIALMILTLTGCQNLDDYMKHYISGPLGGCYYNDSSGNKVYVDHSFCGT